MVFLPNLSFGMSMAGWLGGWLQSAGHVAQWLPSLLWAWLPASVTAPLTTVAASIASLPAWTPLQSFVVEWAALPARVLQAALTGQAVASPTLVPVSLLPLLPTYHLPLAPVRSTLSWLLLPFNKALQYVHRITRACLLFFRRLAVLEPLVLSAALTPLCTWYRFELAGLGTLLTATVPPSRWLVAAVSWCCRSRVLQQLAWTGIVGFGAARSFEVARFLFRGADPFVLYRLGFRSLRLLGRLCRQALVASWRLFLRAVRTMGRGYDTFLATCTRVCRGMGLAGGCCLFAVLRRRGVLCASFVTPTILALAR